MLLALMIAFKIWQNCIHKHKKSKAQKNVIFYASGAGKSKFHSIFYVDNYFYSIISIHRFAYSTSIKKFFFRFLKLSSLVIPLNVIFRHYDYCFTTTD